MSLHQMLVTMTSCSLAALCGQPAFYICSSTAPLQQVQGCQHLGHGWQQVIVVPYLKNTILLQLLHQLQACIVTPCLCGFVLHQRLQQMVILLGVDASSQISGSLWHRRQRKRDLGKKCCIQVALWHQALLNGDDKPGNGPQLLRAQGICARTESDHVTAHISCCSESVQIAKGGNLAEIARLRGKVVQGMLPTEAAQQVLQLLQLASQNTYALQIVAITSSARKLCVCQDF
mmetsp:Transcript_4939/g.8976  ORF Transcript_4939/g.8976 Transcript_4939/m.8976 type:complete len:232 (-) Transcript_4939:61-756(-)